MASSTVLTIDDIRFRLQSDELKSFTQLICSRRLRTRDLDTILNVSQQLQDYEEPLKMAILYLEHTSWNLHEALLCIGLDTADRTNSWIIEENNGEPGNLQVRNPDLNRELARPGDEFDESLFDLRFKTGKKRSAVITLSFTGEPRRCFDKTNQDMVDDLNRWRRGNIWKYVGPDTGLGPGRATTAAATKATTAATTATSTSTTTTTKLISTTPHCQTDPSEKEHWHPLQKTYILNRFAFTSSTTPTPQFKQIHLDYLQTFTSSKIYLPGRTTPCTTRSQDAITSFLHRECIANNSNSNKRNGKGGVMVPKAKGLGSELVNMVAKKGVRKRWVGILDAVEEMTSGEGRGRGELVFGRWLE